MDFLELKKSPGYRSKKKLLFFSSVTLANLPLSTSLQSFFTTNSTLMERLLKK